MKMNGFAYCLLAQGFSTVYVYGVVWELKETSQSTYGCNDNIVVIKSKHKQKTAVDERYSLTALLWRRCHCVCAYVNVVATMETFCSVHTLYYNESEPSETGSMVLLRYKNGLHIQNTIIAV